MPPPTMEQQPTPPTAPEAAPVHRPPPRNVPTLTEMVAADAERHSAQADAAPASPAAPATLPDASDLLALLGPDLDRQISEAIGRVLHEQLLGLNVRVQKAVAEVVREAVATAHTRGAYASDVGKNP